MDGLVEPVLLVRLVDELELRVHPRTREDEVVDLDLRTYMM